MCSLKCCLWERYPESKLTLWILKTVSSILCIYVYSCVCVLMCIIYINTLSRERKREQITQMPGVHGSEVRHVGSTPLHPKQEELSTLGT